MRCHFLNVVSGGPDCCDNRTGLVFDMDPLHRQAIVQGVLGTLLFVVLVFWPAGTFDYWQGWVLLDLSRLKPFPAI